LATLLAVAAPLPGIGAELDGLQIGASEGETVRHIEPFGEVRAIRPEVGASALAAGAYVAEFCDGEVVTIRKILPPRVASWTRALKVEVDTRGQAQFLATTLLDGDATRLTVGWRLTRTQSLVLVLEEDAQGRLRATREVRLEAGCPQSRPPPLRPAG
jgi:hypothetical protein